LWVLPIAFAALLCLMLAVSLPLWQVFNLDPDYYYLLNGLRMVEGLAPTDLSHPGTPVHVLVAAVLRLMHPGEATGQIVDAVLHDPERHLLAATLALYPFVILGLVAMGAAAFHATQSRLAGLLAQSAPFLSMLIPKFGLHAKPEPLIIAATAALAALGFVAASRSQPGDRLAGLFGLVMGFGIACKLQFAALGLLPLFLLDRRRLFIVYPLASVVALFIFVAPALPSWDLFADLWGRILTHSGAYGSGAEGVVQAGRLPRTILKLFSSKLVFTAVILANLALLAVYFRLRRRGLLVRNRMARLSAGIILAQVATVVLISKQPAPHYLIPALMLTGAGLVTAFSLSAPLMGQSRHLRLWTGAGLVLAALTVPAAWTQTTELARWTREAQAFDMSRFDGCAKVWFDAASSPSYALQRGDMNAQGRYSRLLADFMPKDEYSWFTNDHTWWKRSLMQWNRPVTLGEILERHGCAVFRGSQPWTMRPEATRLMPGLTFDDQCHTGEEDIFTKGVDCTGKRVE
jgi:hypothetical protein